jgi:hypothetical protein
MKYTKINIYTIPTAAQTHQTDLKISSPTPAN